MGDTAEMQKAIQMLSEVKDSIINAYQAKTGLSRNKLSKLMDEETWMDAGKAVELHFADGMIERDELYGTRTVPEPDEEDEPSEGDEKPMNCPHHCEVFAWKPRSYKDLPFRCAEFGTVYRYEKSGELARPARTEAKSAATESMLFFIFSSYTLYSSFNIMGPSFHMFVMFGRR